MRVRHPLAWALAGLLVFLGNGMCVVLLPSADQGRAVHYVYALASGMMIFGLVRAEQAGRADALKPRWAQLLGDASYSLYLIHFPLVSVLCKIARAAGLAGNAGAAIAFVVGAAVCVAASMAFHMIVERPLLSLLGSRLGTGKTTVGIAAS
jgi:peptidoglycan/LPS O-acetylase OafA/YrhL